VITELSRRTDQITLEIHVDQSGDVFQALRVEWQRLWDQSEDASEAQSWEWQSHYRRYLAARDRCGIVVARDQDGHCVALAAFSRGRDRRSGLPRLTFLGEHDADFHHILHAGHVPTSTGARMLETLVTHPLFRTSHLEFSNLVAGSWTSTALDLVLAAPSQEGWHIVRENREAYAIPLPSTMDAYVDDFRQRTSRSFVKFDRTRRNLLKDYKVAVAVHRSRSDIANALAAMMEIDQTRWGKTSRYLNDKDRAFHRDVSLALAERGLYRVFLLTLNATPVAYVAGVRVRDSFKIPALAHDPRVPGRYSIGKVLNYYAIAECIGEGCREYDLTRGGEEYKRWLGGVLRPTTTVSVHRTRLARVVDRGARALVAGLHRQEWLRRVHRGLRQFPSR
jgi:CelD/BcsL family acetyltransferase involved in cellulose biosynthesis